ncbi:MAG: cache domain-containing protein, partial [Thermodesulfobacteriota bacterium]
MKRVLVSVLSVLMVLVLAGMAAAQDTATKDEVVAKCKEAAQLVKDKGLEEALKVFNDPAGPFVWKDTYVFAINLDTTEVIAHPVQPNLIGKNLMSLKDVNGKMFFAEF